MDALHWVRAKNDAGVGGGDDSKYPGYPAVIFWLPPVPRVHKNIKEKKNGQKNTCKQATLELLS